MVFASLCFCICNRPEHSPCTEDIRVVTSVPLLVWGLLGGRTQSSLQDPPTHQQPEQVIEVVIAQLTSHV